MKAPTKILTGITIAASAILYLTSCEYLTEAVLPVDHPIIIDTPVDTPPDPIDTIPDPPVDSLVIDSCDEYHAPQGGPWMSYRNNKDVLADPVTFWYRGDNSLVQIDLVPFFSEYGLTARFYQSGINKGGVIEGSDDHLRFQGRIFCRDGFGTLTALLFSRRAHFYQGCLTFDQLMYELQENPNFVSIRFWNTHLTCDEVIQVFDFVLADCKDLDGVIIDLRHISCMPPQEYIDEMESRDAEIQYP